MRNRSLLALLVFGLIAAFVTGCGSSSSNDRFVFTTDPAGIPQVGSLTFNFVTAQSAFEVDANTSRLKFEFFQSADSTGESVLTVEQAFASTITIENVPTSVRSFRITGFSAAGIPLYIIEQPVSVLFGENRLVEALTSPIPVTLEELEFTTTNGALVTEYLVPVGGSNNALLYGFFSEGTVVLLGGEANYFLEDGGEEFASVSPTGLIQGLAPGTTTLFGTFADQTASALLRVSDGTPQVSFLMILNEADPLEVLASDDLDDAVQVRVAGFVDGTQFSIEPNSPNLEYDLEEAPNFEAQITDTGLLFALAGAPGGVSSTLNITYTNSDGTTAETSRGVIVDGDIVPVAVSGTLSRTTLFSAVPNITAQISLVETLSNGDQQAADLADYEFTSEPVGAVSVVGDEVIPEQAGSVILTATNNIHPNVTTDLELTIVATNPTVELTPGVPNADPDEEITFTLTLFINDADNTEFNVTQDENTTFTLSADAPATIDGNVVTVDSDADDEDFTVTGTYDTGDGTLDDSTTVTVPLQ